MKEYWKTHWWAVSTLCFSLPHPPPPPFLSLLSLSLQGLTSVCLFQLSRCDCGLPPASSSFQYNNHTELERGGRKKIFCLSGKLQVELIITYKFLCCRFNLMRAQQLFFIFFYFCCRYVVGHHRKEDGNIILRQHCPLLAAPCFTDTLRCPWSGPPVRKWIMTV